MEVVGSTIFGVTSDKDARVYDHYTIGTSYSDPTNIVLPGWHVVAGGNQGGSTVSFTPYKFLRIRGYGIRNSQSHYNGYVISNTDLRGRDFFVSFVWSGNINEAGAHSNSARFYIYIRKASTNTVTVLADTSLDTLNTTGATTGGGGWIRGYWVGNVLHYNYCISSVNNMSGTHNSGISNVSGTLDFGSDECFLMFQTSKAQGSQSTNGWIEISPINISSEKDTRIEIK